MVGEAHRSAPTDIGADGAGRVRVTISLSRAHAPWPIITFRLRLSGLDLDFRTVSGDGALTADLGRGLAHLAQVAMESEL